LQVAPIGRLDQHDDLGFVARGAGPGLVADDEPGIGNHASGVRGDANALVERERAGPVDRVGPRTVEEGDADRDDARGTACARREQRRARCAMEVAKRWPHRLRPRRRMVDDVAIRIALQHGERVELVEREVPALAALGRHIAARRDDAGNPRALRDMLERMPLVVFGIARGIQVVPQREEGGSAQRHGAREG